MIEWINCNQGFLMVIITVIYVVATIFICIFNGKSVSSINEQNKESCRQQKQNVGIQLYMLRKQALELIQNEKYDEAYLDIVFLFNEAINSDFSSLILNVNKVNRIHENINTFEQHLKLDIGEEIYDEYQQLVALDNYPDSNEKTQEALYNFCDQYTYTQYSEVDGKALTYNYRNMSCEAIELNKVVQDKRADLFLKMREFIKESISQ